MKEGKCIIGEETDKTLSPEEWASLYIIPTMNRDNVIIFQSEPEALEFSSSRYKRKGEGEWPTI